MNLFIPYSSEGLSISTLDEDRTDFLRSAEIYVV